MIKIRFNKRKFKNLLIMILLLIVSFLIGKDYVNALQQIDFTNAYEYNNELHYEFWEDSSWHNQKVEDNYITRVIDAMNKRGKYYIIRFDNSSANNPFFTSIKILEYTSIPYMYSSDSSNTYVIFRTDIKAKAYTINFSSASNLETIKANTQNQLTSLENGTATFTDGGNMLIWWWRNIETDSSMTGNRQVAYYSNFGLKYQDSKYDIKIGDDIISNDSDLIMLYDYQNKLPVFDYNVVYSNLKATLTLHPVSYDTSKYKVYLKNFTDASSILLENKTYTQDFFTNSYLELVIYDINDEFIDNSIINIKDIDLVRENEPFMQITEYWSNSSFYYNYYNIKEEQTCYYKKSWQSDFIEDLNCGSNTTDFYMQFDKNGYIEFQIRDSNQNVIYNTFVNTMFSLDEPYFLFENYFENNKAILNIYPKNYESTDYVKYSNNGSTFTTLKMSEKYSYEFYINMPVFVELYSQNNELKVKGYIYVRANYNDITTENINNANDLLGTIKNLSISSGIVEYVNLVYSEISKTPLGTIIFYSFVGLGIGLICFLIKRK